MKVSFGGNHLLIFNGKTTRNRIYQKYKSVSSRDEIIEKIDNNKILIIDGKDSEDYKKRLYDHKVSGCTDEFDGATFINALNAGYIQKSIIVDLSYNYSLSAETNVIKNNEDCINYNDKFIDAAKKVHRCAEYK